MPQQATTLSIPPSPDGTEINPPCGGSWLRHQDGSLSPADADTEASAAQALGLVADANLEAGQARLEPMQEE